MPFHWFNVTDKVSNCFAIFLDWKDSTPVNNYCVGSIGNVDAAVDGTHIIRITNADDGFSFSAKENLTNLNWADNTNNGEGYWHVIPGDYPSPIKPEGWKEVTREPVWDGTAAENFESGSGTEKDPLSSKPLNSFTKWCARAVSLKMEQQLITKCHLMLQTFT